jgi:hypothetical protein
MGEGSGVYSVGGGVILCFKGIATDIGSVGTENGDADAPRFGIPRNFDVADVSEGSGDTTSSGRLSWPPIWAAIFFNFLISDL